MKIIRLSNLLLILLAAVSCAVTFQSVKPDKTVAQSSPKKIVSTDDSSGESGVTTFPFQQADNMIYMPVQVNGSAPLQFVLDSGAGLCVIDTAVAKKLNLKTEEKDKLTGAGAGTFDVIYTHNLSFKMPGIELAAEKVALADMSELSAGLGRQVDGIIGYELFDRYVVEIDYDANVIRLFEPKTYKYSGRGEIVPIAIKKKHSYITAKIKVMGLDAVDHEYLIDTGASGMVSDPLIAQTTGPKKEFTGGIGLGDAAKLVLARIKRLQLGNFIFENANGVSGAGRLTIAGELLHRFTVILDYSRQQMILEPNRHFQDGFFFDTLGVELTLDRKSKGFKVDAVFNDSVAAEVGLKAGDIITAIDGQPALSLSLEQVRLMFEEVKTYRLGIKRADKTMQIKIKLRKQL